MGYDVEMVMADIGLQYQGVASGDIDIMMMAWLPVTHRPYWERVRDKVINLGPLFSGARLGWVVPAYVPENELGSIEDLRREPVKDRLREEIQGIDPGSGLMQASEKALELYGLEDYTLISASGAAMTAVLERAIRRKKWIVVTGWSPHWMFARWDLRYLKDPKGALGGRERIHILARPGFDQDYPQEVTDFFSRMYLPIPQLEEIMVEGSDSSYEEAAAAYMRTHPGRVHYWITGEMPE